MIDAQAVSAHLDELEALASAGQNAPSSSPSTWLEAQLAQLPLQQETDDAGNHWITLPGATERTVVLGAQLHPDAEAHHLDSSLGLVTGLETLKALARRFDGPPPCTIQLVIWADSFGAQSRIRTPDTPAFDAQNAVAYLELHLEPGSQLQSAGAPLGVATEVSADPGFRLHPQLTALCDEAIRELTGTTASLPAGPAPHAAAMAGLGLATAILYVQQPAATPNADEARAVRLHLLQAAETFGRWAESTVHSVAGDQVDLWAREHRTPHSS